MRRFALLFAVLLAFSPFQGNAQTATSGALIADIMDTASGNSPIAPATTRWFAIGQTGTLRVALERCASCDLTEHAHALVQLPPGLTLAGFTGYNYLHGQCLGATPDAAGQRVTCTGVRGLGGGMTALGMWDLHVQVADTLAAGTPLRFVLAHDDAPSARSGRLEDCITSILPAYCDALDVIARHPPHWDLQIDGTQALPTTWLYPGVSGQRVVATVSSRGEIGTGFFLDVRLPPGYQHNAASSGGNPIGASCTVIGGDITSGTVVRCIGSTSLNPLNSTQVAIGVDVHPLHIAMPGESVVFAIGSTEPTPDPNRLSECRANPDLAWCAWLQVSASACPERTGLDQPIWCNSFEAPRP